MQTHKTYLQVYLHLQKAAVGLSLSPSSEKRACQQTPASSKADPFFYTTQAWQLIPLKTDRISERQQEMHSWQAWKASND